jgi:TIGR03009 family protein
MEWLLKKWEHQSSLLKTLDVTILRVDQNPAWDELEYYEGRALFKSPNLAFIDFNKIKQDEKKKPVRDPQNKDKWLSTPFERIVCTGEEVWQYKSDTQQIFIYPLGKNEKKKAIEEGPLPFLFNMHAEDARQRYQMSLISEDAKGYGVSIKPKLQEDKESFSIAFVNLDHSFLLPVRILMRSPDGKSQKDFRLGPMYPNKVVNVKNFEGKPLGSPWKIVRNPAGEDRPRAGASSARDAQGEPSAARPRAGAVER